MSDETNKTQESELSNEQLDNAAGGYFDEFESFRTLAPRHRNPRPRSYREKDGETRKKGERRMI